MPSQLGCRVVLALTISAGTAGAQQYLISTAAGGAPTPTPVPALSAAVQPNSVATDAAGNVYFSSPQSVFKVDTNGVLTRLAGNGRRGFAGDGGPAVNAQLDQPGPIALDSKGNLYVSEMSNGRVRKVTAGGTITTFAGSSQFIGFSGDGEPAVVAELSIPSGLAIDAAGNVYLADSGNHRIRKVSPDGIIQTIAGNGLAGNSGDGGPAIQAAIGVNIYSMRGMAIDANGVLYLVVDDLVRAISPGGIITTIAGTGVAGTAGDGGSAVNAQLADPSGVAVDSAGNVFISIAGTGVYGVSAIRKISPGGIITTIAGSLGEGFSGDGGPAARAQFQGPAGVAVDGAGNLFIADAGNNRLRRISASGIIESIAGNGLEFYLGDGGPATGVQLNSPFFVAVDSRNNLLIGDYSDQRVRKVSTSGVITSVAGAGGPLIFGAVVDGEPALDAHLGRVGGVVSDAKGDIFIADSDNACVWEVGPGGLIHGVAGNYSRGYLGDGGPAPQASLITPWGLALDNSGNLYIADENAHRIRKVSTDGIISTVAGNGIAGFSGDGGPATSASLSGPQSVAVAADGSLYIADDGNLRIRKVSPDGVIATVVGNGSLGWANDGMQAANVPIGGPFGLALDSAGNLYFSDVAVHKVSGDGIMTTIAGDIYNINNYSGDGGPALDASFAANGLAMGSGGSLYLADAYNGAVRLIQPVGPLAGVNAASSLTGSIAPGEIVTLYGSGIGPEQLVQAAVGGDGLFDAQLAGTVVTINGIAAPLIYAWTTQTSAIVPYGVTGSSAQVTVTYQGQPAATVAVPVAASAPGIFAADSSGLGQAAAINQDGTLNSAASPAAIGDIVVLFATGEGQTSPAGVDGQIATAMAPQPVLPVMVTIGGQTAQVQYAGGAPGEVAGVMQLNVEIPSGIQTGAAVPVLLRVGGVPSQTGVTLAIR